MNQNSILTQLNTMDLNTIFATITAICAASGLIFFIFDRHPKIDVYISEKDKVLLEPNKLNLDFSVINGPLIEVIVINSGKVTIYPDSVYLHVLSTNQKLYMVEKDTEIYTIRKPVQELEITRTNKPNQSILPDSSRTYYLTFESIQSQCSLNLGQHKFQALVYFQTGNIKQTKKITCTL
jgi:hypothetical protein